MSDKPYDPDLRFENAPILELTVEFAWKHSHADSENPVAGTPDGGYFQPADGGDEFDRFAQLVAKKGFNLSERLFPYGIAPPVGRPLFKYEGLDRAVATVFVQLGLGYMSVTAFPPYQSWKDFRPHIAMALEALLETRSKPEQESSFDSLSLRYINAFQGELVGDYSFGEFVTEVMGFKIEVPASVAALNPGAQHKYFVNGRIDGGEFSVDFSAGESTVNGEPAAILDLTFTRDSAVAPDREQLLEALDRAHQMNRTVFLSVTEKSQID